MKKNGHRPTLRVSLDLIQEPFEIRTAEDLEPLVHWRGTSDLPIHRWFRYREGYSPSLITELDLGNCILDPFCGSGSILLGSAQLGRTAVGIDINPLAVFVARVKLNPLSASSLQRVVDFCDNYRSMCVDPWPTPGLRISHKVFEPIILDTLMRIRTALETIGEVDSAARDFLFLGWLAILQQVGSYFKEGNGIKYRNKKRTKNGYVVRQNGKWQKERFGEDQAAFVYESYSEQLKMMISDTKNWVDGLWEEQQVVSGSALEMNRLLNGVQFDSIIFSPPYANRFDYFESQKVELWFGDFIDSYADLRSLRQSSLRSHLGADLSKASLKLEYLEDLISLMDTTSSSWRMGVPSMLRGYFDDMYCTLKQCRSYIKHGCCYIVVGNSAFAGVIIPTDAIIARLGLQAGFSSAKLLEVRHLTVAPQQRSVLQGLEGYMRESIVVLQ